ncbi:MAG: outer membrane protein assembly factor BamA [Halomonadaceae bacterium]|nr:MAG: outer membrane protein assembly factor BamA [Halomonadaceae bacterium]
MRFLFRRLCPALLLALCVSLPTWATDLVVSDIEVEGLQRVSAGSVFGALPIEIGDRVDNQAISDAIRALFRTGLFTDVSVARDNDVLVITVEERPSIASIEVEGNRNIETDQLMEGMRQAGIREGQVFQRATLERLELEILRSYVAQGRYNARVEAEVEELPRNRVALQLNINEGDVAAIQHINIIGNEVYSDAELISLMELRETSWWNSVRNRDKYARERLGGDLERLRSWYLDRGFIDFSVESTDVSIAPDKKEVFITLGLAEGPQYRVRDTELRGDLIVPEEELERLIILSEGDVFSRERMNLTSDLITRRLSREGYSFARVNAIPQTHDDNTATVVFEVIPGKRTYVRKINFVGNTATHDEVLRQEMRQMESGIASNDLIEASRTRLERTGYFRTVEVDTVPVPGSDDRVDVTYRVEEQPTGSLSANVGFSQVSGLIFGANISERNFFGTGRRASFGVNTSRAVKSANISYTNPFYTVDGVSRSFSLRARQTDFAEEDIASFVLDSFDGRMSFGYPINNTTRLNFGVGYSFSKVKPGDFPVLEIRDFIEREGDSFDSYLLTASWVQNTLNRGVLPTAGYRHSISGELAVPGSDLTYYKVNHRTDMYFPLTNNRLWVARLRTDVGFGDGYGETDLMPFFEHFFAGGFGSVRGYDANSLGRRATQPQERQFRRDTPFGGNVLTEASAELIFPVPFAPGSRSMRTSFFIDGGNVFDTRRGFDPSLDEIRYSAGISFQWITAIGPLGFSLAEPLNDQDGDDSRRFQFSLGQEF